MDAAVVPDADGGGVRASAKRSTVQFRSARNVINGDFNGRTHIRRTFPRYLSHWSIDTGHQRRLVRTHIPPTALAAMQEDLAFAVSGGRPQIMAGSDATMSADVVEGMGLLVTVSVGDDAIITFAVAGDRSISPSLWRRVHNERRLGPGFGPAATDRENPPRTPWLLERHEPGILRHRLEDGFPAFQNCAAWAWLARLYGLAAVKDAL